MSGLSLLADYSSGSEECSDIESSPKRVKIDIVQNNAEKRLLPLPSFFAKQEPELHVDDPTKHSGRKRSFPHERGNWSTYVYVPYEIDTKFLELINKLHEKCCRITIFHRFEEFHISLTRTLVLKFHWITNFISSLKTILYAVKKFPIVLDSLEVYTNDDNTRTFLGLKVGPMGFEDLRKIIVEIDDTLKEFKLPVFYEDPSFHISILWCLGNKKEELESLLPELQTSLNEISSNIILEDNSFLNVQVDNLMCKSGNKVYNFPLQ